MALLAGVLVLVGAAICLAGTAPKRNNPIRHYIVSGDTLSGLADRYGVGVATIRAQNEIKGDKIRIGETLRIEPAKRWFRKRSARRLRGLAGPADGFDFPVGSGSAAGYYDAQPFGENDHLGEDWNGTGGGNSDLGDPVLASASGIVVSARNRKRGWGNVVRVVHNAGSNSEPTYVETLYAHLDSITVRAGEAVKRGEAIGTIGTAGGKYRAHLHFEVRTVLDLPLGAGYSKKKEGFVSPSRFIRKHRPAE